MYQNQLGRLGWILAAAISIAAPGLEAQTCGAVFAVDATFDAVDTLPGDGFCATAAGPCTLRAAVEEANALPCADTIDLPAGTYVLELVGRGEDAGRTGDLDVLDDLTIAGAGETLTIIDAAGIDRVLEVVAGTLTASGVTLRNGDTRPQGFVDGGGILSRGDLALSRVRVINNRAGDDGGGIWQFQGAVLVEESTIAGNQAFDEGGGFYFFNGTLSIEASTIHGNSAGNRGGGVDSGGSVAPLAVRIVNSTLSGNRARAGGGLNLRAGGEIEIVHSTLVGNEANTGGGVRSGGATALVVLDHAILADNSPSNCAGSVVSEGHNLDSGMSCGLSAPSDLENTDPILGPLAANGGPTTTHLPLTGSPAIDGGAAAGCPERDQRGVSRPLDGDSDEVSACDIGAVEVEREGDDEDSDSESDSDSDSDSD